MDVPCKAKHLSSTAHGKFPEEDAGKNNIMEYSQFLSLISDYLPGFLSSNEGFKSYLRQNPKMLFDYADNLVMTLPSPRTRYYESVNFDDTQRKITTYANQVTDALGYYPVVIKLGILDEMKSYSQAVLFMGLIFDIIILLFVIIAILLIYSLLMISVETKTLEMGIIRMVGLSKIGITVMVLI
jgi:ABC-type antimicrobial peptide transport system permease subunit